MKKNLLLTAILCYGLCTAQVGINTTTPNSTLTIDGSLETAYKEITSSYTLTQLDNYVSYTGNTDASLTLPAVGSGVNSFTGRIYKIKNVSNFNLTLLPNGSDKLRNDTSAGISSFIIPPGYYTEVVNNANNMGTGTWDLSYVGYPKLAGVNYTLENIYDYTAVNPQLVSASGTNLTGFSQSITIPANKDAKIIISYSIPVGTYQAQAGYYGITLMKNGTEIPAGSRKFTIGSAVAAGAIVSTINASIADNISASASAQTITYSLKAYLESANTPVSFCMTSATEPNFNWGRGYWSLTVFYK